MPIFVSLPVGGKLVSIESTSVTTTSASVAVTAMNHIIINDGIEDITFAVKDTDDTTQTLIVPAGTSEDTPFVFKLLTWATASGTGSFKMRALRVPRVGG